MNYKMVGFVLGRIFLIEAALMLGPIMKITGVMVVGRQ